MSTAWRATVVVRQSIRASFSGGTAGVTHLAKIGAQDADQQVVPTVSMQYLASGIVRVLLFLFTMLRASCCCCNTFESSCELRATVYNDGDE